MTDKLKQEYSTFIEEISEILGFGKPVDILKLCATTDRFFTPLQEHIAGLEKENKKLREQLGKARELLGIYVDLHYKPIKTESELRSEASELLMKLEEKEAE